MNNLFFCRKSCLARPGIGLVGKLKIYGYRLTIEINRPKYLYVILYIDNVLTPLASFLEDFLDAYHPLNVIVLDG